MSETNMDDRPVEDRLRGYRPSGPGPALRERCLRPALERRAWPWLAAAAAVLACTLATRAASSNAMSQAGVQLAPIDGERAVRELTERLGGDEWAGQLARRLVDEDRLRLESDGLLPRRDAGPGPAESEAR
jgi:hypothetical protein